MDQLDELSHDGGFNSRLREEATSTGRSKLFPSSVSTHASVRRRQGILKQFNAKEKRVLSANGIFLLLIYVFIII